MNNRIKITISKEVDTAKLTCVFQNTCKVNVCLRDIYYGSDVVIANIQNRLAKSYITSSFRVNKKSYNLQPGEEKKFIVNLLDEFEFPSSGEFSAHVKYSVPNDKVVVNESLDKIDVISNKITFSLEPQYFIEE